MGMITSNVWEIEKEIRLHGHIEWRSKKNLDEFVCSNTFDKDICIVGYITPRTVQKWDLDIYGQTFESSKRYPVYVGVRKNIPQPVDYSRYR